MKIALHIATLGPIGYLPRCPGTFGSLPGIAIAIFFDLLPGDWGLLGLFMLFCLSVVTSHKASQALGKKDPSEVVIDETMGMALALYGIKLGLLTIVASFILFRLMDILKPPPVRQFDTMLGGGLGIVMDDVAAGIMANLLLRFVVVVSGGQWP